MKFYLSHLLIFVSITSVFAQKNTKTVQWEMLKLSVPNVRFVPRELFKVNDTTIYLGSKYYLFKLNADSLQVNFQSDVDENVIRSVVDFNDSTYISVYENSIFVRKGQNAWSDMLSHEKSKVYFGWEMIEYNSELVSSAWPRWISTYNFKNKTWISSTTLDKQGAGYISDFEKIKTDLYVSMYGGGVFKKDRHSDNWIDCNKNLPKNLNIRAILSIENKRMYATTEDGIYYSKMNVIKWKPCKQTTGDGIKFVDIRRVGNYIFVTGTNGELMIGSKNGKKWQNVKIVGSEDYVLYSVEELNGWLYISADGQGKKPSGVFRISLYDLNFKLKKGIVVCYQ